jgi:dTDP-4-dehydrorhamnose reductase
MARPLILVTGAKGQVGQELVPLLRSQGDVVAVDREEFDLGDPDAVRREVRALRPSIIVNTAAHTAVDAAETDVDAAHAINAVAPGVLAEEAKRDGALLVHYSTDYVFDGRASAPYDEDSPVGPQSVYGRTKLDGERAVAASGARALILRTSWVYGLRGKNFLLTIRRLAAERDELRIVADQIGVPNWSRALAEATAALVGRGAGWLGERAGLYHFSSTGPTTWHAFAQAIVGDVPRPRVVPITTDQYPTPAQRPAYSVLSTARFERTFGFGLGPWQEALARCLRDDPARTGFPPK